jgi:hypothetical protein
VDEGEGGRRPTWYLVRSVLQTPVSSIMATRNGIMARAGMIVVAIVGVGEGDDDKTRSAVGKERKAQGGGRSAWIKAPGQPGWNHRELLVDLDKYQTLSARNCLDLVLNGGAARCPL